jgi:hypothetical protein
MSPATLEMERRQRLRDAIAVIAIDKRELVLNEDTDKISSNTSEAAKQDTFGADLSLERRTFRRYPRSSAIPSFSDESEGQGCSVH